jgi:hypothetical protein
MAGAPFGKLRHLQGAPEEQKREEHIVGPEDYGSAEEWKGLGKCEALTWQRVEERGSQDNIVRFSID